MKLKKGKYVDTVFAFPGQRYGLIGYLNFSGQSGDLYIFVDLRNNIMSMFSMEKDDAMEVIKNYMENKLTLSLQKSKLEKCLINIALNSGFNSFVEFKKYKENTACFLGYKAVYPKFQDISRVEDKIYVKNLKVMTGQNLYDSKTGSVLKLSDKLSKELGINEPPINWWASEKWDGIRALWDGEKIISRGSGLGNPKVYTYVPKWFLNILPPGIALDGEIWIGRGMFQSTGKLSNIKPGSSYSKKEIDEIWSGRNGYPVIFKVFDVPSHSGQFEQRMEFLQTVVEDR